MLGLKGVRQRSNNSWEARCHNKSLGCFSSQSEAYKVYCEERNKTYPPKMVTKCEVIGCERICRARGKCNLHYKRFIRIGSVTLPERPHPIERFFQNYSFDKETECWNWTGHIGAAGYGLMSVRNKQKQTHRISWELFHGTIPKGMFICHHCDNRKCVNPMHLFMGTHLDNIADMVKKKRTATGIQRGLAKLTPEQVLYAFNSKETQRSLARKFNISPTQIHAIRSKKEWRWLTCP